MLKPPCESGVIFSEDLVVPSGCRALLNMQFTRKEDLRRMNRVHMKAIQSHMPSGAESVLDLGGGVGRMTAYMAKFYPSIHYYIADYDIIDEYKSLTPRWNANNKYPGHRCNRLDLTKEFLEANGVENFTILDLSKDELPPVDFLFSFYAVGFHYPIGAYDAKVQMFQVRNPFIPKKGKTYHIDDDGKILVLYGPSKS